MPSVELLLTFFAATALFAYMPGPALLYAAAQTVARGRRAGLMAAIGLHVGGYFHVIAAAAGLSALFHAVPMLYLIVKVIGAGYLAWLGLKMIRSALVPSQAVVDLAASEKTGQRAFAESVTVEVLNPKTALFFVAFLPQFAEPAATFPIWLQLLVLGTFVNIVFSSADLLCVYSSGLIVEKLRRSTRVTKIMEGLGGSILVGLGAHLALQR